MENSTQGVIPSEQQMLQQQAEQAEMKERRDSLLLQILSPEAKTRSNHHIL